MPLRRREKPVVVVIGPTPPPYNGMSVTMESILGPSLRRRFELAVLDIADRRSIRNMGRFDAMNVALAMWHSLRFLGLLLQKRPDAVYLPVAQNVGGYLRDSLFLVPCRLLGVKTIVHLHGSYLGMFYRNAGTVMQRLIRYTLAKVSAFIVLGESLREVAEGIVPHEKVVVVQNGVDDHYDPALKNEMKVGRVTILYPSNICREKGIFHLLECIPEIVRKNGNVRFIIAGEWVRDVEERRAKAFIEERRIGPYIEFTGVVQGREKKEILNTADIMFMMTLEPPFEGQPLVILEAMSAGLPIIASDAGAIPETVRHGENGFIIGKEHTADIERCLSRLIENASLRREMGRKSRERYTKMYTREAFSERLGGVLQGVL